MGKRLALLACWLGLSAGLWAGGARYGMTRAEVEAALGQPTAALTRGPRFVLLYPRNGVVELEGGVVVKLSGVPVDDGTRARPAAPPATTITTLEEDLARAAPAARVEHFREENRRLLREAQQTLAGGHDRELLAAIPNPSRFWSGLGFGLLFRTLVTVVVLKVAFKWSDVHADWSQMFLPALADTFSQAGVSATAFAVWHTTRLFYVDVGISYFVLLGVLMKTTHACTLSRAVAVAGAAKLASFVIGVLIAAALLNLMP